MKIKILEWVITIVCFGGAAAVVITIVLAIRASKAASTWESVSDNGIHRVQVPTGWLVRYFDSICFVPDPAHDWVLK